MGIGFKMSNGRYLTRVFRLAVPDDLHPPLGEALVYSAELALRDLAALDHVV